MTKRKAITERMKIDALLMAASHGAPLCTCGEPIDPGQPIDWDHYTPLALSGDHHYTNLRPLHRDCHRKKTSGTKATSAGSDIHKIAKVKRIAKGKMAVVKPLACDCGVSPNGKCVCASGPRTKRKWPKGRKMQSRPFPKREKAA